MYMIMMDYSDGMTGGQGYVEEKKVVKKRKQTLLVKRGEVYWADLSQGIGSEQAGVRPVVIVQNDVGNRFSTTVIVACISSQIQKGKLPTHIEVGKKYGLEKDSVVLCEQLKTIDKVRLKERITCFNPTVMSAINQAILVSVGLG